MIEIVDHSQISPVLVHVPHSSRNVPPWAREGLLISDDELTEELDAMTDAHTHLIAREANESASCAATLFINQLSRLVVDPERFPDDREEMLAVGMGAVYTKGHSGRVIRDESDQESRQNLIEQVFQPYSKQLSDLVERIVDIHGRVVIIDLHSFPRNPLSYELHADWPRPQICLGADEYHTSAELLETAREAFGGFDIRQNTPFAGSYVPLEFYARDPRVLSIMVEIRRDQYLNQRLAPHSRKIQRLAHGLAALVDSQSLSEAP